MISKNPLKITPDLQSSSNAMFVISTFRDQQFFNRCKVLGSGDDSEKRFKITLDPQSPSNSMFVISTFRDH